MFKKLSLELGGKNPNIIFADCNYEEMVAETRRAAFANQGEILSLRFPDICRAAVV
jgi:aminomuconate-semialdehyde/2-hydroxymuconate-6-semialdehyde dehydrogenase